MTASGEAGLQGLLLSLPPDVLHHFFSVLTPRLLAILSCCCRAARDEIKACEWVWREHCQHTWQSWPQQVRSAADDGRASWRSLFAARRTVRLHMHVHVSLHLTSMSACTLLLPKSETLGCVLAQMERKALQLLQGMEDPMKRHACMRNLATLGEDVLVIGFVKRLYAAVLS